MQIAAANPRRACKFPSPRVIVRADWPCASHRDHDMASTIAVQEALMPHRRFDQSLCVDDFTTVNRRAILRGIGTTALVTASSGVFGRQVWGAPVFAAYPFALGIASGDPAPDGFVLWTKVAPKPLEHGGGMPKRPVEDEW